MKIRTRVIAAVSAFVLLIGGVAVALTLTMTGSGTLGGVMPGWSVLEECTPSMPGDSRGRFGSASLTAAVKSDSRFVMDNELTAVSPGGTFSGRVSDVSVDALTAKLSVAGPGQFLNVDKTMPPVWFNDANDFLGFKYGSDTGQVGSVYGIAVDPVDGGILVTSFATVNGIDRYKVIKYTAAGVYVTEFGSSGSGNGQFGATGTGIAVSPVDQSVWVTDASNFRIQKFVTADGGLTYSYSTKVGASGAGNGQFGSAVPMPIAVDASGNVYVGDKGNNRIQKFNSSAAYQAQVSVGGGSSLAPYSLAFNAAGTTLYASILEDAGLGTSSYPGAIKSYNTSLSLQATLAFTAPAGTSTGIGNIALDTDGNIWAQWFLSTYLVQYSSAGVELSRWQSLYPSAASLNTNLNLASGGSSGIYVLFRPNGTLPEATPYGGNYVTGFDFSPVMLSSAVQTYMEACDTTLNGWTLDYQATDYEVVFPGWTGNVWANLKELMAIYNVELVYDHSTSTFIVRDIGSATTTITDFGAGGVETIPQNLTGGRIVDVIYQQPRAGGGVVWDAATENVRLSISAGQTDTRILYTVNHPAELAQPVPTDTLPIQPGQYYVTDSTGTAVPAATWLAAGANITLAVGNSPGTISATIIGPPAAIPGYTGPYSFATGNTATSTPALSIVGNGTFCTPRTFIRAESQGQPFNSPFMDTLDRVLSRGHAPSQQAPNVTIQFSCPVGSLPGIGETPGTVIAYDGSKYRLRNPSWGNVMAGVSAERHVTIADIDARWSGQTIGAIDTFWSGYSLGDQAVQPLRT